MGLPGVDPNFRGLVTGPTWVSMCARSTCWLKLDFYTPRLSAFWVKSSCLDTAQVSPSAHLRQDQVCFRPPIVALGPQ